MGFKFKNSFFTVGLTSFSLVTVSGSKKGSTFSEVQWVISTHV